MVVQIKGIFEALEGQKAYRYFDLPGSLIFSRSLQFFNSNSAKNIL